MTFKNKIVKISLLFFLVLSLVSFYKINFENYKKHIEIKQSIIEHPENLPTKDTAIKTAFGFKNLRADLYWLQTVQYIGSNAISSDYKKYLFIIIDLITELNPYFEHPYIIGGLLLPDYNERYEKLNIEEQEQYIKEGEQILLKGINNFCDLDKIELIKKEEDLTKIWTEDKYKNPCKTYSIPYYLAFLYYFYKDEPILASTYYKITSANSDSGEGMKIMAAIMQGKGGNREKSYFMFLNLANFVDKNDEACNTFSKELEKIGIGVFMQKSIALDDEIIKAVENARLKVFGEYDKEDEEEILSSTKCSNYVNKATRELNLAYIEEAGERFKKDNDGKPALNAKGLFDEGYLKFLPTDFQKGIIYEYNKDTKNYDYSMGTY